MFSHSRYIQLAFDGYSGSLGAAALAPAVTDAADSCPDPQPLPDDEARDETSSSYETYVSYYNNQSDSWTWTVIHPCINARVLDVTNTPGSSSSSSTDSTTNSYMDADIATPASKKMTAGRRGRTCRSTMATAMATASPTGRME